MTPLDLQTGWGRRAPADFDGQAAAFIIQLVALSTGVRAGEIGSAGRHCAKAARARQIAMYLAHTAYGWPLARVAAAFGRDRSTASHACKRVEDLRDDVGFDGRLARMEGWVRSAPVEAGVLL